MTTFDPVKTSVKDFPKHIKALENTLAKQEAEIEHTRSALSWYRSGYQLFAKPAAQPPSAADFAVGEERPGTDPVPAMVEVTLLRDSLRGSKPSLRKAILIKMLERPPRDGEEQNWTPKAVVEALRGEGWLPAGMKVDDIVGKMLRDMAGRGEIKKPSYGVFRVIRKI
jgi:hypothetical protein